jgi:hypothetical protein
MKSSPRKQPELILLRIKCLHAPHVGRHQLNSGVEKAFVKSVEVARLNQESAYVPQPQRIIAPCIDCGR